jgi:hypothetical protein
MSVGVGNQLAHRGVSNHLALVNYCVLLIVQTHTANNIKPEPDPVNAISEADVHSVELSGYSAHSHSHAFIQG